MGVGNGVCQLFLELQGNRCWSPCPASGAGSAGASANEGNKNIAERNVTGKLLLQEAAVTSAYYFPALKGKCKSMSSFLPLELTLMLRLLRLRCLGCDAAGCANMGILGLAPEE